jgi:hypothetical protein
MAEAGPRVRGLAPFVPGSGAGKDLKAEAFGRIAKTEALRDFRGLDMGDFSMGIHHVDFLWPGTTVIGLVGPRGCCWPSMGLGGVKRKTKNTQISI